jgi:hypothetical protein
MPGTNPADCPAGHPDSRTANFPEIGALLLSQSPWPVLVKLDIGAGGNAEMEVKLSMKILQVAVTIDEPRQNGFTVDLDHLGVSRNSNFTGSTHRRELAFLDNDRRVIDRWPAGAIDQFPTAHNEYFLGHLFSSPISYNRLLEKGSLPTNGQLSKPFFHHS